MSQVTKLGTTFPEAEGAPRGTIGYDIAAFAEGNVEVEVSDPTGSTVAQLARIAQLGMSV